MIVLGSAFQEDNKYYPQVYLHVCINLQMSYKTHEILA